MSKVPAVAYLRVSTEEQDIENQRNYLMRWANERNIEIVAWYEDEAVSGAVDPFVRPGFRALISDIESGRVQAKMLLVYEFSRLVRNFDDLFRLLDYVERRLGLVVVSASPKEAILQTTDGAIRRFLLAVFAFVAHMEREFIRMRTRAALQKAKQEGKIRSIVDEIDENVKMMIIQDRLSGMSLRKIAQKYGISLYAVRRILTEKGLSDNHYSCPRCFARLKVVERSIRPIGNSYVIVTRLRCDNCGYEKEETT
ncbi:MAG: recombinase family protein [Aquifex sp.]|nr:MAG: recombinase family protein [Aquifex sp.]